MRFGAASFFASIFADGMPVLANDFSQSREDGPRMFPSMKARPGQRVQLPNFVRLLSSGSPRIIRGEIVHRHRGTLSSIYLESIVMPIASLYGATAGSGRSTGLVALR